MSKTFSNPYGEGAPWIYTLPAFVVDLLTWLVRIPIIIAATLILGLLVTGWYSNRPQMLTEIENISLGMTEDEVTASNGAPDHRTKLKAEEDGAVSRAMRYGKLRILLEGPTEAELMVWRICDTNPSRSDHYNGVNVYDSEKNVIRRLGEPTRDVMHADKLGKTLHYEGWNLLVDFDAGSISSFCIGVR